MADSTPRQPLRSAEMVSFLATNDAARSREFFEKKLGFDLVSDDSYALVFDAHGRSLRIQKLKDHTPKTFTVLGWNVADIEAAVSSLAAVGIPCEIFGFFEQDPRGITTFPDGTRVAWFKDPDGNILSVAQMARS